jgi:predicted alpha-1,6-mannanase (GH76 family)
MALIFKPSTVEVPEPAKSGFNWDDWYQKNKTRLSEKRAKRYREDAAYRAAALKRSRAQRSVKKEPVTDKHTVSFNDAAQDLNVTVWVLREWRRKNYFPEPHRRDGRLWFSPYQVELLRKVGQFFDQYGARLSEARRPELESLVSLTYANWQ